jgi:hypothetical protein
VTKKEDENKRKQEKRREGEKEPERKDRRLSCTPIEVLDTLDKTCLRFAPAEKHIRERAITTIR